MNKISIILLLTSLVLLQACASTFERAESFVVQEEWIKAVIEYRKVYRANPGNIELKSRLAQTELKAADYYYQKGVELLEQNNLDGAMVQFQLGLVAMPNHGKLAQVMNASLAHKEANDLYVEAVRNQELNKSNDVIKLLKQAIAIYPEHAQSISLLKKYQAEKTARDIYQLALESKAPITLNFKNAKLKTVFDFIVKSFGINVIFDESVKNTPVTLYAKEVTFDQALNLTLRITKTFYKKIGSNTILIAPDNAEKHGQYEDYYIRTYYLKSIAAKDMAAIIKNMLAAKKMVINEELNSITLRDTDEILELAEHLIEINDRKPAEMILEVEILEVNRTKAVQLGLDFGSQITSSHEPFTGSFSAGYSGGIITVPNIIFRYFKQDVDANTLANPKLRVMDNKKAKIHIGDRIPFKSSSTSTSGITQNSYTYQEIGIRLEILPDIHLDNSVTISLSLEVSSLGQDLGSPGDPAFSIGTRNAESVMLLKDGETAILGGLIRDEERHSQTKVPGLGDIPLIGALFTTFDNSTTRTDVLLTITPRIIRSWDLPLKQAQRVFSGTEKQYSTKSLFGFLEKPADDGYAEIILNAEKEDIGQITPLVKAQAATNIDNAKEVGRGVLRFDKPQYPIINDELVTIELIAENIKNITSMPIELLFNSTMMEYVKTEAGDIGDGDLEINEDANKGVINLNLSDIAEMSGDTVLARVTLKAKSQGVSYLIYRTLSYIDKYNKTQPVNIRASRIVIK
jgi:general secretion pathway protein D